ncbi:MAG TPA: DUF2959 family protein [Verrucomicrobiae bacterium]
MTNNSTTEEARWMVRTARWALLIVAIAVLAGCRSTGYVKSDATAWKMQDLARQVRAEGLELKTTTSGLDDLVNTPSGNLRPQFQQFGRALDQLVASKKRAGNVAGALERKRTAYFEGWDKQTLSISAEDLRKQSEARRREVSSQYETTFGRFHETQQALAPLIGYLQDIRKALDSDLTVPGLQAVKPSVVSTGEKATQLQAQLTQSADELDGLAARMSSFAPQESK